MTAVVVIAKECLPGRVKTRLQPEFTAEEAAAIATAALTDTLRVGCALPASRRILYFDGAVPPAAAAGWEVLPQRSGSLDERIAALFDMLDEPVLLLGMDTPHVDPATLTGVFADDPDVDAWFGPATDGGFWALALRRPDGALVLGVPMSTEATGFHQLERLRTAGLRVRLLPALTDIDTAADVPAAAQRSPALARALDELRPAGVIA
ncbi:TIGR04282 family arsenosugar biosynthesis glycosyltransferase [Leifsonia sp. RAF41]|uniref:TIGR04282 family arsenosugar biosynthesis glycosyltransferase n=1 Tax=Leifsonia sp. RAF41 TaxID=3233056 RepID=UPI003F9A3941